VLIQQLRQIRAFGGTLANQGFVGREGTPRSLGLIARVR
jgi:hypothetical protein